MTTIATLEHVTLRYGARCALEDITLNVPAGQLVGVIGPDGVGKSSLLALIAGARRLQTGTLRVMGENLREPAARARVAPRIAYMPQGLGRNLYPRLSVAENLEAFGALFGLPRGPQRAREAALLAATGLREFADRAADELSGGMRQKLGLCCALLHDPALLILDEPTTGVDPLSRQQFWALIRALRDDQPGLSVLVATAYMEEAARFDTLVSLDAGRLTGCGRVADLLARTHTTTLEDAFVALLPPGRTKPPAPSVPPLPPGGPIAIEARGLSRRFGRFTAVDNVSFSIASGEIFGFLGSNGCGKTTTMKMLAGLLAPSAGEATIFGAPLDASAPSARAQVGYMSQMFSLYRELSVRENLALHARLFGLPAARIGPRIEALTKRFSLTDWLDCPAQDLPLGLRQRLSLAVALVHSPRLLILDEPTAGVDPIARDEFWAHLVALSREEGVTIFLSTHFMQEAERCDRVSFMHQARVLASDTPARLKAAVGAATLEAAFIAHLAASRPPPPPVQALPRVRAAAASLFSAARLWAVARREARELWRDPIRVSFALIGAVVLMGVLGFGISMDVENLRVGVLDRDATPASRAYIANLAGGHYFRLQAPIDSPAALDARMQSGELAVALEIPPGFGRDLARGTPTEIGAWLDGALPFRGETARGYLVGMHQHYLASLAQTAPAATIDLRYRYNQSFRSIDAMVPAVIALLLIFLPAVLMALGVVREKELGSIVNLFVTPLTRFEFLVGKQLPYVALTMLSFALLFAQAVWLFEVPIKGSLATLTAATLIYAFVTTSFGLMFSTFTRTQIAALFGTAIFTMLPTVQFSGLTTPVSSLVGVGAWIGKVYPAAHYLTLSRGVFTKALGFWDVWPQIVALAISLPLILALCVLLCPRQAR